MPFDHKLVRNVDAEADRVAVHGTRAALVSALVAQSHSVEAWLAVFACAVVGVCHVISSFQTILELAMPRQSSEGWFLQYPTAKASARLLISMPSRMLVDAHAVAKAQGISVAELARRAMTHHMAEVVKANSAHVAIYGTRSGGTGNAPVTSEHCTAKDGSA